jgi:hypothetical protein
VRFLGSRKPWDYSSNPQTASDPAVGSREEASFLGVWWQIFQDSVRPLFQSLGAPQKPESPPHPVSEGLENKMSFLVLCRVCFLQTRMQSTNTLHGSRKYWKKCILELDFFFLSFSPRLNLSLSLSLSLSISLSLFFKIRVKPGRTKGKMRPTQFFFVCLRYHGITGDIRTRFKLFF